MDIVAEEHRIRVDEVGHRGEGGQIFALILTPGVEMSQGEKHRLVRVFGTQAQAAGGSPEQGTARSPDIEDEIAQTIKRLLRKIDAHRAAFRRDGP
ncbi:MAG TPA: hypothetical protein PLA50_17400, partial [Bacteroidia bacterium]|nr:hypothetical protein [Bacteroidia bacterium]